MSGLDVIEPYIVPEIFVDGFTKHTAKNGVMSCVGYRSLPDGNTVVVRLVWPVVSTEAAIADATAAMKAPAPQPVFGPEKLRRGIH